VKLELQSIYFRYYNNNLEIEFIYLQNKLFWVVYSKIFNIIFYLIVNYFQ